MPEKKNKAAVELGKLGGSAKTDAKAAAARANGASGGRPTRFDLDEDCRELLSQLITRDITRLNNFKADDPSWSKFWSNSIAEREALAQRFAPERLSITLSKGHMIELLQLLAPAIVKMERDRDKDPKPNKELDKKLAKANAVAQHIDEKLSPWAPSQPSLFAHFLKEARNAL